MANSVISIAVDERGRGSLLSSEIHKYLSRELFFGIVGHVGSGTSAVADKLRNILGANSARGKYHVAYAKASDVIRGWAEQHGKTVPQADSPTLGYVQTLQDLGDEMRQSDSAAIAKELIRRIRGERGKSQRVGADLIQNESEPIIPDGKNRRAYVLDSLKHPAEANLLRRAYGDAFVLVGVVCNESARQKRITDKYKDAGSAQAQDFMRRDAGNSLPYGQRVSDTFHLSDYFIDNSINRFTDDGKTPNTEWKVADDLERLIKLVTHDEIERPQVEETAMYAAAGAAMRSSCLSRQVGAAVLSAKGDIVATGTNEVPKAGGGVYGKTADKLDGRCFKYKQYCRNTKKQADIARDLFEDIKGMLKDKYQTGQSSDEVIQRIRGSRVGELLEFSRAVHAEMDALLEAGRKGISTVGARVFVTAFPCHYCARHLVAAGAHEVQYIEPYPKSLAVPLHDDSIKNDPDLKDWKPLNRGGTQVLFRLFTGVAPRMYSRAFLKLRELKDSSGALHVSDPEWGSPYDMSKLSYPELEVKLIVAS